MQWLAQRIIEQGTGPTHRHYGWRSVLKATPIDSGVDEHLFLNELIEIALGADGLSIVNLHCFEMVARRLQP